MKTRRATVGARLLLAALSLAGCGQSPSESAREKLEVKVAEFDHYLLGLVAHQAGTALDRAAAERFAIIAAEASGDDLVWQAILTATGNASLGGADTVSVRACLEFRVRLTGETSRMRHADVPCPHEHDHQNRFGAYDKTIRLYG